MYDRQLHMIYNIGANKMKRLFRLGIISTTAFVLAVFVADAQNAQKNGTDFDVQHYKIDAELLPSLQQLKGQAEVRFVTAAETRSVVFEINGSLTVKRVARVDAITKTKPVAPTNPKPRTGRNGKTTETPAKENGDTPSPGDLQFIQNKTDSLPNVRIDLGTVVPAGQTVTLLFEYDGPLESAQGGVISNARLAYVGEQGSYLLYSGRWFPFHDYVADLATSQISIKVPKGVLVAGYSDLPVSPATSVDPKTKEELSTFTFTVAKPGLPGTLAAAKYITRPINQSGFTIDFYVKAGDEKWADHAAEVIGKHLEYYSSKFGRYAYGNKLIIAETDEETLDIYSGPGIILISPRALTSGIDERLSREVAYQWWGQAVGLRSFDDTWLSQGLAEFSTLLYEKDNSNESQYTQTMQAELEKALAFEQSASISRAPQDLDDQTPAYRSVVFYKGALIFNMLRQLVGDEKFDKLLRDYYVKYQGKNVKMDDFEAMASLAAGRDLRFFFGQWLDSTGVPEFRSDYRILRGKEGFRVSGTVKQDLDTFEMPLEIMLRTEAGNERQTLQMKGTSADFELSSKSKPIEVIIDPGAKIMRSSPELREGVIVRRGIEHFREQEYTEAEQQFQAAIKLNSRNSWAYYNLGLVYFTQRNWNRALDAFDQALNGNIKPDWIEVFSYIYRGNCWDMIGQRERAIAEYNKAIANGNNYDNAQASAQGYLAEPYGKKKTEQQSTPENQAKTPENQTK
jgi:tetratricopeptide (TPR) repeat protein